MALKYAFLRKCQVDERMAILLQQNFVASQSEWGGLRAPYTMTFNVSKHTLKQ